MAKNIRGFLENLTDYFWILLWMSTSLVIWNFNITQHYPEKLLQVSLQEETEIDGRGHEIFSEKFTGP